MDALSPVFWQKSLQCIENKGLPVQKVRKSPQRNENEEVRWTLRRNLGTTP
jgi:hypothetical protein